MFKKSEIEAFLYNLFSKRKRRICILLHWFASKTPIDFDLFFKIILTEPISISIYPKYFRIFERHGLNIYYSWLEESERLFIHRMFKKQRRIFGVVEFYANGDFAMRKCIFSTLQMWPIEKRREMLRDFVWMFLSKFEFGALHLLGICQRNLNLDRFVLELHEALQGRVKIKEILCVY